MAILCENIALPSALDGNETVPLEITSTLLNGRDQRGIVEVCPLPPPILQRNTTNEIETACDIIQSTYAQAIKALGEEGVYGPQENLKSNHYFTSHGQIYDDTISAHTMKKIMREITKTLPSQIDINPRGTMFVRYDDVSPQYLRALITGVEGTPYSSGLFVFDIYLPPEYPAVPCLVKHVTPRSNEIHANNGPGGFSPNLHSDSGQVCLSLLGTWDGPGWEPESSNVYQVLSSILWMIFGALHPYYMEPGFGGWEGTAPTNIEDCPDRINVIQYDEEVKYYTALLAILAPLQDPPKGFEKVTRKHFIKKRKIILSTINKWLKSGTSSLQPRLQQVHDEIKAAYQQLRDVEMIQEDISDTREAIDFIEKKMKFLRYKIAEAGGEELAPTVVPKAWQRFCLGPKLLTEKRNELAKLERELASFS